MTLILVIIVLALVIWGIETLPVIPEVPKRLIEAALILLAAWYLWTHGLGL
jgi:hypothetical protein